MRRIINYDDADDFETYYYPFEKGASGVNNDAEVIVSSATGKVFTVTNNIAPNTKNIHTMVRSINGSFPYDMIEPHLYSDPSLSRAEFLSSRDFSCDVPNSQTQFWTPDRHLL